MAESTTLRSLLDSGQSPLDFLRAALGNRSTDKDYVVEKLGELLSGAISDRENREMRIGWIEKRQTLYNSPDGADVAALDLDRIRLEDAWEAELLSHPEMVDEVVAAVADAFDRARIGRYVDTSRSAYPLEVAWYEGTWRCDGCGSFFEADEAPMVWVGERDEATSSPTDHGYQPSWCVPCVEDLVERAKRLTA